MPGGPTTTCQACLAANAPSPSVAEGLGVLEMLHEGWAQYEVPRGARYWVCPRCVAGRTAAEYRALLGDRCVGWYCEDPIVKELEPVRVVRGREWEDYYATEADMLAGKLRPEEEITRLETARWSARTEVPVDDYDVTSVFAPRQPDPDAPVARVHARTEDIAATMMDVKLWEELGRGGAATVYRVENAEGEELALKVLRELYARDPRQAERFRREREHLARLRHPNIVQVLDYRHEGGTHCFLMELVPGVNLRHLISRGPVAFDRALDLGEQLCAGLAHAHERGVTHRDIKPENLLLSRDGVLKIVDFGIAKYIRTTQGSAFTGSGEVFGTHAYMAPEQLEQTKQADHRADVFAAGLVVYELLVGEPAARPTANGRPELKPVDPRVDPVLWRATSPDPAERHGSAAQLGRDLMAARLGR